MFKKASEDKSLFENVVRKPVSPSGAILICRRKELAQQPGLPAFCFEPTANDALDALVFSLDFTLAHGGGSSQILEYFRYTRNIRWQQRAFINISKYMFGNHLPGSEGKCCRRKTFVGKYKIEQNSPGSESIVLTRHKKHGLLRWKESAFSKEASAWAQQIISTPPVEAESNPGLTILFPMRCRKKLQLEPSYK